MTPTLDHDLPVDPALAVDQVLTTVERKIFRETALVGPMQGRTPADWIGMAADTNAFPDRTVPWWNRHGDKVVKTLTDKYEIPRALARALTLSALYGGIAAKVPIDMVYPVTDLAARATMWTLGYMQARPDPVQPARRVTIDWQNDDYVHIAVDGQRMFTASYDEHGSDGMRAAIEVATLVAEKLGAVINTQGTPGR